MLSRNKRFKMAKANNKISSTKLTLIYFIAFFIIVAFSLTGVIYKHAYIVHFSEAESALPGPKDAKSIIAQYKIDEYEHKVQKLRNCIGDLQPKADPSMVSQIANIIHDQSRMKGLDPLLVAAIIQVESEYDPFAESDKGAVGLMQIRYSVWKEEQELVENGAHGKKSLFWIETNIKCGTSILKKYIEQADGDIIKALYRYNTGSNNIKGARHDIDYVSKIMLVFYDLYYNIYFEKEAGLL